eukprot:Rhum_TRINITY_DN6870_c0_g1::Rhum_TRINITY_DN6870_c0_g1_i1::g.21108::m.21108
MVEVLRFAFTVCDGGSCTVVVPVRSDPSVHTVGDIVRLLQNRLLKKYSRRGTTVAKLVLEGGQVLQPHLHECSTIDCFWSGLGTHKVAVHVGEQADDAGNASDLVCPPAPSEHTTASHSDLFCAEEESRRRVSEAELRCRALVRSRACVGPAVPVSVTEEDVVGCVEGFCHTELWRHQQTGAVEAEAARRSSYVQEEDSCRQHLCSLRDCEGDFLLSKLRLYNAVCILSSMECGARSSKMKVETADWGRLASRCAASKAFIEAKHALCEEETSVRREAEAENDAWFESVEQDSQSRCAQMRTASIFVAQRALEWEEDAARSRLDVLQTHDSVASLHSRSGALRTWVLLRRSAVVALVGQCGRQRGELQAEEARQWQHAVDVLVESRLRHRIKLDRAWHEVLQQLSEAESHSRSEAAHSEARKRAMFQRVFLEATRRTGEPEVLSPLPPDTKPFPHASKVVPTPPSAKRPSAAPRGVAAATDAACRRVVADCIRPAAPASEVGVSPAAAPAAADDYPCVPVSCEPVD